jgi:hypothetical protein
MLKSYVDVRQQPKRIDIKFPRRQKETAKPAGKHEKITLSPQQSLL